LLADITEFSDSIFCVDVSNIASDSTVASDTDKPADTEAEFTAPDQSDEIEPAVDGLPAANIEQPEEQEGKYVSENYMFVVLGDHIMFYQMLLRFLFHQVVYNRLISFAALQLCSAISKRCYLHKIYL